MSELLILDPSAVATDRVELDLTPFVRFEGVDFGESQVEAYMASGRHGAVPVDHSLPNTTVTVPLNVMDRGAVTFEEFRRKVQAKVALFQAEGGWVGRSSSEGTVYGQVVGATLVLSGDSLAALGVVDARAALTLEVLGGEWLGEEITLDAVAGTGEIVAVLEQGEQPAVIRGDRPGWVRVVVSEDEGADQRGLIWGFRSRYYDDAATAALAFEAEDLTPLDQAEVVTWSGASPGGVNNTVQHDDLGTNWTPVLSTEIDGVGHMTHRGTYRVWARVQAPTEDEEVDLRFIYSVGTDLILPATNAAWTLPGTEQFYIADLGEVRLDPLAAGTHRWHGMIQGRGANGGEDVVIDKLWLQPVAENAARLSASLEIGDGLANVQARDALTGASAALHESTAVVGGDWSSTGDSPDFFRESGGAERVTAGSDGVTSSDGRFAVLSPELSGAHAEVAFSASEETSRICGILARFVDTSNYMAAIGHLVHTGAATGTLSLQVWKVVSGGRATLASQVIPWNASVPTILQLDVDATGAFRLVATFGLTEAASVAGQDSALATGGTLASGKFGLFCQHRAPGTSTFSDFSVSLLPPTGAVVPASATATLATDGMLRDAVDGGATAQIAHPLGDLPRIPPSGLEERPVELLLKASRGDLGQLPDGGIDDVSVQIKYRPSFLYLPEDTGS